MRKPPVNQPTGQRLDSTMWRGPKPTFVPSGILIYPAVWPQRTWAENWGLHAPLPLQGGEPGPHISQWPKTRPTCGSAYLHAKLHLDPSNCLATIHQRYKQTGQTGQDRQRSHSIRRTVLQKIFKSFLQPVFECLACRTFHHVF